MDDISAGKTRGPVQGVEDIKKIAERLKKLTSAEIYDVLDRMGHPHQCLDLAIRPLDPAMKLAGPAFTLAGGPEPRADHEFDEADYRKHSHFEKLYDGCIIVIAAAHDRQSGHGGELNSIGAKYRGAKGIVIDGGIRDAEGLLSIPDWPVFVRYTSPIEAKGRYRNRLHLRPIAMTGSLTTQVRVNPGDWIFADRDGVIVIPIDLLDEVLATAEELNRKEEEIRKQLWEGGDVTAIVDKFGSL